MLAAFLLGLSLLVLHAAADFSITLPGSSKTYTASGGSVPLKLEFKDDGDSPAILDVSTVTLVLCTGSDNDNIEAVSTIKNGLTASDVKGGSYTVDIDAAAGASGVYYIQFYSTFGSGTTIHYTNRFELKSMTGTHKPSGKLSQKPPEGTNKAAKKNGQNAQNDVDAAQLTLPADHSKSFTVPYTQQTGLIRFAPMQTQPASKTTATTWTRKYPTSSVSYYSTYRTSLDCLSTVTPGWSYTRTSLPNYATPAPYPAQQGSWYPASAKLATPSYMTGSRFE